MAPMADYDNKLEIVTEEVGICKLLTSNDFKIRKRGISSLKKWFRNIGLKKGVEEDDFLRIWNGLFYYVWMSDKPLVQEEAAECISGMMHILDNYEAAMYYIRGFFKSLVKQWDRISHYRIDKFLMLVRRFLRQILILLYNHEWNIEKLELFSSELYSAIQILPYSLALHLNEIFNEEVAKISKGKIPTDSLVVLYKGYFECIANLRPTMQIVNSIQANIFGGLVRQLKLYIKQKAVTEDCDNEKNNENSGSDDEVKANALDPRPGGVDVFLPFIEFDEHIIVKFIEQYTSRSGIPIKAKNILNQIIAMFASISKLRLSVTDTDKLIREMQGNPKRKRPKQNFSKLIKDSCKKLEEDENEAKSDERVLMKLRNLTDLIQIPSGKSTFTVVQAKPKVKETKRSSISNNWTVTETAEEPSAPKKARVSGSTNDWVIEETTTEDNTKKSLSVSFSEKPTVQFYEDDSAKDQGSDAENEIIVPASLVKSHPNLMKKDREYVVVDFQSEADDEVPHELHEPEKVTAMLLSKEADSTPTTSVSKNDWVVENQSTQFDEEDDVKDQGSDAESEIVVPASVTESHPKLIEKDQDNAVLDLKPETDDEEAPHEPEKVTRTLRSRKVESTPSTVSTPDSKRTRKPREKKVEPARKSSRIAEKQKKVLFKLESNTYQDISSYEKVLKSKPELPFNGSRIPSSGILKPFAVTTPINPFYFANGERKLKRKRK